MTAALAFGASKPVVNTPKLRRTIGVSSSDLKARIARSRKRTGVEPVTTSLRTSRAIRIAVRILAWETVAAKTSTRRCPVLSSSSIARSTAVTYCSLIDRLATISSGTSRASEMRANSRWFMSSPGSARSVRKRGRARKPLSIRYSMGLPLGTSSVTLLPEKNSASSPSLSMSAHVLPGVAVSPNNAQRKSSVSSSVIRRYVRAMLW